jgi:hypothetical protein
MPGYCVIAKGVKLNAYVKWTFHTQDGKPVVKNLVVDEILEG